MKRRLCAWLLILTMLFSGNITAFATQTEGSVSENTVLDASSELLEQVEETVLAEATSGTAVTRIEWLKALNTLFEISVEEDNYPDNYYSDIDATDADYYDIMLATEFGLVDVPAGSAFDKNGAATREFAAHTLNLCLGFIPESETYSFSEAETVTYPDDIQAAIEQNWFALSETSFLPNQAVTSAEKENILALATEVYNEQNNPTVTNTWEFKSSVKVLPEGTKITTISESELSIENCPVTIAAGDVFGIVYEDMPFAWKATKVSVSGTVTTITVDVVSNEDAFETISVSSELVADLTKLQPANENIDLDYIVGGTEEQEYEDGIMYETLEEVADRQVSAVLVTETFDISDADRIKFNVGDAEVKATCKVTGAKMKKGHTANSAYVNFYFTADFNCNVSVDALKASGISPSLTLFSVELAPCTLATFALDLQFYGEANLRLVEEVTLGLSYQNEKFYLTKQFKKKSFTISAQATIQAGVKLTVSFKVPVLSGTLTGKMGVKETLQSKTYADNASPTTCQSISAYFYANIGYSATADFGIYKKSLASKTIDIFDKYNSPIRVAFHYEDGKEVPKCTRGTTGMGYGGWGYFSPVNSQYYYNGYSSTSTDANGNTYTIFTYSLNSENKATITGYKGTAVNVFIPDTLDGYEVIAIGASAFSGNKKIKSVSMPDSVTTIGYEAFSGCTKLENVFMEDSITRINYRAFEGCTALNTVTLSKGLVHLGGSAFRGCTSLKEIEIPKSLTEATSDNVTYSAGPFINCSNLKTVVFENGTTVIAPYLFANCTGLESITIPDTVTYIDDNAFDCCENLKEITLSKNLVEIGWESFSGCTKLEKISMPKSVKRINYRAFEGCTALNTVTLSKGLVHLGGSAFRGCTSLKEIEIPKSLTEATSDNMTYSAGPFINCSNLKTVVFENGTTVIAPYLFANCTGLESITIPDTVTYIDDNAFDCCENLKEITLSKNLVEIGWESFSGCTKLEKISMPKSVKRINYRAFEGCTALNTVTLSKGLVHLGGSAFRGCTSLKEIEIPKSLTEATSDNMTYSAGPFINCSNLKTVVFENGTTVIASYLFANCTGLESITIPNTVTHINIKAFDGCTNLKTVSFSSKLNEIDNYAFRDCKKLEAVTLPTGVKTLGAYLFQNCTSLREAYIPDTVTDMGNYYTFYGCTSLEKVHIPNIRQNIGTYMFYNCTSLSEINLPSTLVAVRSYAFYNCDSLTSMNLPSNVNTIESYAFYDCDKLQSVTIPNAVTSMGSYAFQGCEVLSSVSLGTGLTSIPSYAFAECPAIKSIVIPYQVTKINNKAFYANTALTEVTIPRSVTSIGTEVFSYPAQMTIYGISGTYAQTYANDNGINFVNRAVAAKTVTLSSSACKLFKGDTKQLFVTVTPSNFTDSVSWKSTNTNVVSVESDGTVYAEGIGTAYIKVAVGNVAASCKVTVTQPVTSIYLSKSNLTMAGGETYTLTADVYPSSATNKTLTWTSSDPSIASVSAKGVVTAKKKGTTTITATAADGSGKYDTCEVTVNSTTTKVSSVSQMQSTHPYTNDSADSWMYTIPGAGQISVTFSSSTEVEAGFDYIYIYDKNGNLIGKYTGKELAGKTITIPGDTVRIQLVADDSGNAYGFTVTQVKNSSVKVIKIKLTGISKKIAAGKKITLTANIAPSNATNKAVTWKSSNTKYATVSSKGVVTVKKAGAGKTVKITATAKDGSGKTATYKIKIMKHKVTSVKLKASKTSVKAGKSVKVKATVKTSGKKVNKTLKWTSSNTKYATVTKKGVVKTKKAGKGKTVTITATSTDGTNKKAKVKIKIK